MQDDRSRMTLPLLARGAASWFEWRERQDGEPYTATKHAAPEWIRDLVREAHGEMLPNDWRYEVIHSALLYIAEAGLEDADELDAGTFADEQVDTYSGERVAWLASHGLRAGYCDEAREEGLTAQDASIIDVIGAGQYVEALEVFESVRGSLTFRLEEMTS